MPPAQDLNPRTQCRAHDVNTAVVEDGGSLFQSAFTLNIQEERE